MKILVILFYGCIHRLSAQTGKVSINADSLFPPVNLINMGICHFGLLVSAFIKCGREEVYQ